MAFEVRYSDEAENDLDEILHWLMMERKAGETGLRWFQGLQEHISTLSDMPERCALAQESESLPFVMRQLLYGRRNNAYRVLFVVEDGVVQVLAIRRPHEDAWTLH